MLILHPFLPQCQHILVCQFIFSIYLSGLSSSDCSHFILFLLETATAIDGAVQHCVSVVFPMSEAEEVPDVTGRLAESGTHVEMNKEYEYYICTPV